MSQLLVRNLDVEIKDRLRKRAARNGRSMEAEARDILKSALAGEPEDAGIGTQIARRFRGKGLRESDLAPKWPVRMTLKSPFAR